MYRLFDPAKKVTLILANPRHGSHYLAQAVLQQALAQVEQVKIYNEFVAEARDHIEAKKYLLEIESQPGYKIVMVNDLFTKLALLTMMDQIDQWYAIRLTHNDRHHLALSAWYWMVSNRSPLTGAGDKSIMHHGTDNQVYDHAPAEKFSMDKIIKLINGMNEDIFNYQIPCDLEIDYKDLKNLGSKIAWNPNEYRGQSFAKIFGQDLGIDSMFRNLSFPMIGKFKEKS